MPPRTKRGVGGSEAEDVGKLLLRLKLRIVAPQNGGASAARECLKAAQIFESGVDTLERGASALPLALSKGSAAEANASIEKAKQLSMDITSVLYSFTNTQAVFADIRWHLLRPVMRLLLWLVPEHLPTPVTVSASTVTVQPPVRGTAADEQSTAPTQCDEGWREEAAITFAREVATATLAKAVLDMGIYTVCKDVSIRDSTWHRGTEGARILEECLIWSTLIARLRNIASALTYAGHQPPALPSTSSRLNVERVSLAEYLLSELPKQARILTVLGSPVWFWLHGHSRDNSSLPAEKVFSRKAVSAPEQRAFAASFQPSKELANASGLWRPPAVMLQQMVLLLAVPLHGLPCNPLSEKACLDKVKCHLAALTLLQPGEYLASQGDDLQGYAKRLPSLLAMHLRGLALMFRLALGFRPLAALWELCPLAVAAHNCLHETIAPVLVQDPHLSCAVRYLPQGMVSADDIIPALIFLCKKCDAAMLAAQQHQLEQHRQQQQHEGPDRDGTGMHRQEVTVLSPAELQHAAEPPQHSGQMTQQQSGVLLQSEGSPDQDGDMLDCAVAAGELMRLAWQALEAHPGIGDEKVGVVSIAEALLFLLQLLRPTAYSASTLGSRQGRAWVLCLFNIARRLHALVDMDDAEEPGARWNAISMRVLLEQMLPALQHAAGSEHRSTLHSLPASGAGSGAKADHHPGYSALLLLEAAAHVLNACFLAAQTSHAARMILSQGLQHAGSTQQGQPAGSTPHSDDGGDDLETAVHAAQTLAAELVSGGAWWQEAKAHYPLLLIDTLHALVQFLPVILSVRIYMTAHTATWKWSCTRCAALHCEGAAAGGNVSSSKGAAAGGNVSSSKGAAAGGNISSSEGAAAGGNVSSRPGSCSLSHPQEALVKQGVSMHQAAASRVLPQSGAMQEDGPPSGSHLCSSVAAEDDGCGSSHHTIGFSPCRGSLDSTSLKFALVGRLWQLLSDRDIVGHAPRPAAWMQETEWYAKHSAAMLWNMLAASDGNVRCVIDQLVATPGIAAHGQLECSTSSGTQPRRAGEHRPGTSGAGQDGRAEHAHPSAGQGSRVSPCDTRQIALQLASLVPHVTMEEVESGAEGSPGWGSSEFISAMSALRGHLGVEPALRVVCMLALAGHLDEQQRRVVIALLGGRGSSSSDSSTASEFGTDSAPRSASFLPIPEPPRLAEARQADSITLQDLAIWVLSPRDASHPAGVDLEEEACPPVADHVLLAFGADHLPGLALVHGAHSGPTGVWQPEPEQEQQVDSDAPLPGSHQEGEEEEVVRQRHELQARARRASQLLEKELMAQYQSWLRSSLLKVML